MPIVMFEAAGEGATIQLVRSGERAKATFIVLRKTLPPASTDSSSDPSKKEHPGFPSLKLALDALDAYPWHRFEPLRIHPDARLAVLIRVATKILREDPKYAPWAKSLGEKVPSSPG